MEAARVNILLISYVFPPYYGIGGRRWAKHADGLTKLGYTVHVICAKNPFKKTSLWYDLVKNNSNIIVHQLPAWYPKVLVDFEHSFIQKIMYKFWVAILPFFTKGSFLDRTIFWKKPMLKKATEIIHEKSITHVICTGGPFGVMHFSTLLKKKFNNLFLINDLRDPWTWGPNWGFPNLSATRMAHEIDMERETMERSDIISVPSDDMREHLISKYPDCANKFIRIPHFFDPGELKLTISPKHESKIIRFVMYGNIYHNIEPFIKKTIELFAKYSSEVSLDVFTDKLQYAKAFEKGGAKNVKFHSQIPAVELFNKFTNYDFVFLLNPKYNRNNISTKFYEIIYTKTPIFIFCDDGLGPKFLVENNLGIHSDLSNIEEKFKNVVQRTTEFKYNNGYDIDEYSLDNIVRTIAFNLQKTPLRVKDDRVKNVLITFDYELFLGSKSGTAKNCIIEPTNSILDLLSKYKIKKSLFFVDTIYLMRLISIAEENDGAREDYKLIFEQLVQILKNGHFIFPHIHPHWLEATYNKSSKQWILKDLDKYRFHNVNKSEREILFRSSINFIRRIQESAGITYDIDSYRAGGWCIQPFEDFKPFFEEYKIKHDFSVLSNFQLLNEKFYYDFSNFPEEKIYRFESNVERKISTGQFTEFSITNIHLSNKEKVENKLFLKLLYKLNYHNFGDGQAVIKSEEKTIISDSFVRSGNENIEMTSIELLTIPKLRLYKRFTKNNSYIHFITHPKMLNKHNIFCFENYLKYVLKNFKIETDYKQIKESIEEK